MKLLILAAGSGTRLGDLTEFIPKSLVEINNKTILERQMNIFQKFQKNNVIVIAGPNKDKFSKFNVEIFEDLEYNKHEQLGSLISINRYFDEDVIVIFSDIIFDEKIFQDIINIKCDIGIALDKNWKKNYTNRTEHPISQADLVKIKNNRIIEIKKNLEDEDTSEFIGILKFSSTGWKTLIDTCRELQNNNRKFHSAKSFQMAFITDMIQEFIDSNRDVKPIFVEGSWLEIDTLQDLNIAKKKFRD